MAVSIGNIANAKSIPAEKLLKISLNYQQTTDFKPEATITLAGGPPPPRPRPQPNRPQAPQNKPQAPQNNNQNGQNQNGQNGQNGQNQNGQSGKNGQEDSSGITIKLPSLKFPFGGN